MTGADRTRGLLGGAGALGGGAVCSAASVGAPCTLSTVDTLLLDGHRGGAIASAAAPAIGGHAARTACDGSVASVRSERHWSPLALNDSALAVGSGPRGGARAVGKLAGRGLPRAERPPLAISTASASAKRDGSLGAKPSISREM